MKVLVIKVSALGDVVHALPVLPYLASSPARPAVDWLVEARFVPLLTGHPLLNDVLPVDTRKWRRHWPTAVREMTALQRRLRAAGYDLVIDLQGNSKSGMFTFLTGAPDRCGFDRHGVREGLNLLATNRRPRVVGRRESIHIVERNLRLAAAALPGGQQRPLQGPLFAEPAARERVAGTLRQLAIEPSRPLVVLHHGTTWETKLWARDYWRQLARKLAAELGAVPLLTWGTNGELAIARQLQESCPAARLWPGGDLKTLVALLERADLVIGGDTGPIHLAAALGTPTVSLYRATDHRRNGPRGERHRCLQSPLACSPCLRRTCDRQLACSVSIKPAAVLAAAARLLPPAGGREPANRPGAEGKP